MVRLVVIGHSVNAEDGHRRRFFSQFSRKVTKIPRRCSLAFESLATRKLNSFVPTYLCTAPMNSSHGDSLTPLLKAQGATLHLDVSSTFAMDEAFPPPQANHSSHEPIDLAPQVVCRRCLHSGADVRLLDCGCCFHAVRRILLFLSWILFPELFVLTFLIVRPYFSVVLQCPRAII